VRVFALCTVLLICAFSSSGYGKKNTTVKHPTLLSYDSLDWKIPSIEPYINTFADSATLLMAPDDRFPLVNITLHLQASELTEPKNLKGIGSLHSRMLKAGGVKDYPPDSLDLLIETLALHIGFSLGDGYLKASLFALSEYTDTLLSILGQIITEPLFDSARFATEKQKQLQAITHRFDNPEPLLSAAYQYNLYRNTPVAKLATIASVEAIEISDLKQWHNTIFAKPRGIISVSGDFSPEKIKGRLQDIFPHLTSDSLLAHIPDIDYAQTPQPLIVQRELTQASVRLAMPAPKRPHPDYYPLSVLNMILGGSGFTSRLATAIRSDAGLAYVAGSRLISNYLYPSTLYVGFQTKNESVSQAIQISLQEIEKIKKHGVTDEELELAKKTLIDGLPSMFRNVADIVNEYGWSFYHNRTADHYKKYPEIIAAVSKEDIQQMAQKYLKIETIVPVIVGDTTALYQADTLQGFSLRSLSPKVIDAGVFSDK